MNFKAPDSSIEDDDPCKDGADCKFRGKQNVKGMIIPKAAKPKGKKEKKAAHEPSRLFDRLSPDPGKEEAPPSPSTSSEVEEEESEKKDGTCDGERTFLVRVRPGMAEAEVMFLNNVREDGWEGPFDLKAPLQTLLDFDLLPLPRRAGVSKGQSSSDEKKGGSEGDGNESKEKTRPDGVESIFRRPGKAPRRKEGRRV